MLIDCGCSFSFSFFILVSYGLRNKPRDMVERPSEVNEILRLLAEGNRSVGVVGSLGSRSGDLLGIRGMGGLGKTILALAVAWEAAVSRQVIWLDIGETPDCLALINILVKVLGGNLSFNDIREAQSWIKANTVCMHSSFFSGNVKDFTVCCTSFRKG